MADRKVSASMTLEARQFRAEAKACAEDLNKMTRTGEMTAGALNELQDRTDKAGVSLLKLAADSRLSAAELKKAEKQVDDLKMSLVELGAASRFGGGGAGALASVEAEAGKARLRVKELGDEFRRTGSASSFSGLKDAQKDLARLESLAKDIGGTLGIGGQQQGRTFGQKFTAGLTSVLDAGPTLWVGLGVSAAAAGPEVGAMLGGAILTGIGLAGIGAGIAGQIHDPEVVKAAQALGKDVSAGFKDATASFRAPLIGALTEFEREFNRLQPGMKATFAALAPLVTDLAHGAAGFVDTLVPGLERAAVASRPLVADLSGWLPRLGSELSGFLGAVASHESEAADGLRLLTNSVDLLIGQLTMLTDVGSHAFDWAKATTLPLALFTDWHRQAGDLGPALVRSLDPAQVAVEKTTADLQKLQQQLGATAVTADTLAGQMSDRVFSSLMSVDQANLSVASSLIQVSDALKQNKRDLNLHHAAGVEDTQAILGAVQANIQQYDALIQSGVGAQQAAAAYDQNTAALERQLRKAGLTQQQIDGLIGKYKKVPDKVNTLIAVVGLTDAINRLADLLRQIYGIADKTFNTYVVTHFSSTGKQLSGGTGQSRGSGFAEGGTVIPAARGMIYAASNPPLIKFAEPQTGGEAYIPRLGIPAAQGLALANTAASWYGGRVDYGRPTGGLQMLQLAATFVLPDGSVSHKQLITYALNTGRAPAQLWSSSSR